MVQLCRLNKIPKISVLLSQPKDCKNYVHDDTLRFRGEILFTTLLELLFFFSFIRLPLFFSKTSAKNSTFFFKDFGSKKLTFYFVLMRVSIGPGLAARLEAHRGSRPGAPRVPSRRRK